NGAGLAGAFSQNIVSGGSGAYVQGSQGALSSRLDLAPNTHETIYAVGASLARPGKIGIAGPVSPDRINNSTHGNARSGTGTTDGAVGLTATDSSNINADGGGLALVNSGGEQSNIPTVSVGFSVGLNSIGNPVKADIVGSKVTANGVALNATSSPTVQAVTIG